MGTTVSHMTTQDFDAIRMWLNDYVDSGRLPFGHVKITRGTDTLFEYAYGFADIKSGEVYQRDKLVRVFSLSKIVTAVAILQLVDDGLLELDQDVAEILPEFDETTAFDATLGQTVPRSGPITIRQLLTHSSGLTYAHNEDAVAPFYRKAGLVLFYPDTLENFSQVLAQQPLLFQPGTRYHYSTAFGLLGRVVEVCRNTSFADALHSRIFAPLGLEDIGFEVPHSKSDRFVCLYEFSPEKKLRRLEKQRGSSWMQRDEDRFFDGGGGLVSTVGDFTAFMDMLRRNGTTPSGDCILSDDAVTMLQTDQLGRSFAQMEVTDNGFYPLSDSKGLGVYVVGADHERVSDVSVGEYGWSGAASLQAWVNPGLDISVVFATQLFPSDSYPLYPELNALIYKAVTAS